VSLNVDSVKHPHLCGELFGELNVVSLLFAEIVHLDCVKALIQVFEELSVLLPRQECSDERFLLLLKLDELLQLLLLEFVTDEFDVLAEVANLGNLLLLGLCQLGVYCVNVLFDLFLGLQKRLTVLLFFCDLTNCQVTWIRLRVKVALVEALPMVRGDYPCLQW
jgi:hypothetical protein